MDGQLRIDSMFAFVAIDDDGTEGVIGVYTPDGWLPLVGADMERVQQLRPLAQMTAKQTGAPVLLLHFTQRTEVEVLRP